MKKNKIILCAAVALLFITTVITASFSRFDREPVSQTEFMLDTICTVTLYDWNGDGNRILAGAFELCAQYEGLLSATKSGSDIDRINHAKGNPVKVSQETARLLTRAIEYCRLSSGEFDITIYPVKNLWDFSGESDAIPDAGSLSKAAESVNYTKVSVDGSTVTVPDGMGIDLGAIAKGFIADKIAHYLRKNNVTSAVIDLGGNVYALGSKPDGRSWRIGIRKPFEDGEADVVEVADSSVVTSGIYQRYFERDGKIYHHILRSSDGMPCDTGLYSVTVISSCSEQCDALSTVCMLLGYEKALPLLDQLNGVRAVFITSDSQIIYYK